MDTTDWSIAATAAVKFVGALVDRGLTNSLGKLAKARSRRIQHVPASGADLYHYGVPLTEMQFREVFGAYRDEL